MRTSSTSGASPASTSRTGWPRSTHRLSTSPPRISNAWSTSRSRWSTSRARPMPLSLRRGTVTAIVERLGGLDRIEVDGERCVAYPRTTGPVEVGDEVVINVQAVELGLGSGGFHVVDVDLNRAPWVQSG